MTLVFLNGILAVEGNDFEWKIGFPQFRSPMLPDQWLAVVRISTHGQSRTDYVSKFDEDQWVRRRGFHALRPSFIPSEYLIWEPAEKAPT